MFLQMQKKSYFCGTSACVNIPDDDMIVRESDDLTAVTRWMPHGAETAV